MKTVYLQTFRALLLFVLLLPLETGSGCHYAPERVPSVSGGSALKVIAVESFWGSLATQLGGTHVQVTSLLSNPSLDPHDYEPVPADARMLADAQYVLINGAGYDAWAQRMVEADPVEGRKIRIVSDLAGERIDQNPHLWYDPDCVLRCADGITRDLKSLDPADAAYFDRQKAYFFQVALAPYLQHIQRIRRRYRGTPIAATESIFSPMARNLGLNLITPPGFMAAISEGQEPSAEDRERFGVQISQKQIAALIYNTQNETPDTIALKKLAERAGIPVVAITETLGPAQGNFEQWQDAALQSLEKALAHPPGR